MESTEAKSNLGERFVSWWKDYARVLKSVFRSIGSDNVTILASGLVYSSLIALVPCITFLFVFFSAFGVLQPFLDLLEKGLSDALGNEIAFSIISMLNGYTSNAMSLGIFGIISFMITGMFLVNKIYTVINQIFRTRPRSGTMRRFSMILIFIIVFAFVAAVLFAFTYNMQQQVEAKLKGLDTTAMQKVNRYIVPWLLLYAFFMVVLIAVPNAKVRFGSANVAAITGLVSLLISSYIFKSVVVTSVTHSVIYGSLASFFFLLLYIYIFWYIVISISELSYIHQFRPDRNTLLGRPQLPGKIIAEAVNVLLMIADKFSKGNGPASAKELSRKASIPMGRLASYLNDFEESGLLVACNAQGTLFMPSRPLDQITLMSVISVLYGADELGDDIVTLGEAVAKEFFKGGDAAFKELTLENLLERL